jgi:cysteine desulfurase
VANLVAFGKACEIAAEELNTNTLGIEKLRNDFEAAVAESIPDVVFNGRPDLRIPTISNISFRSVEGEGLLINLDMQGVAVSTGSACSSGSLEPSPVIRALGREDELARGAIRFSFGKENTVDDVERVLEILPNAVENLRRLSRRSASTRS